MTSNNTGSVIVNADWRNVVDHEGDSNTSYVWVKPTGTRLI